MVHYTTWSRTEFHVLVTHPSEAARIKVGNVLRQSHICKLPPGIANIAIQEQQRAAFCISDQPPHSERSSALLRL